MNISENSTAQKGGKLAYTVKEAAQLLGLGYSTVRKLVKAGDLGSVRAGQRVLVPATALAAFLDPKQGK